LFLAEVVTAVPASAAYINAIRTDPSFAWSSINRGDNLAGDGTYVFANDGAGGAVVLATPATPSGDNKAAVIQTTGGQKAKWDKPNFTGTGVTAFMVFQVGDNAKNGNAGNWSLMALRSTNMNINMAANASGGLATIYFDDKAVSTDPAGNIGTKTFTVPTNTWLQWWITVGAGTITIQDVSGASSVTLVSGAYTQSSGSSVVRFGDESGSGGKDSDLSFDEIYLKNSVLAFPEPATLVLLALGGAFPLLRRRSR
jgi:hypothetical protein